MTTGKEIMSEGTDAMPVGIASTDKLGAGSEARKPTALLDWSLYVDCPKCSLSNNLASSLHDGENNIARHIFHNEWDKLEGWEVTCEGCEHNFTIERVEY